MAAPVHAAGIAMMPRNRTECQAGRTDDNTADCVFGTEYSLLELVIGDLSWLLVIPGFRTNYL
jgi:hypothetical protein